MISFFRHHLQGRFLKSIVYLVSLLMILPYSLHFLINWFVGGEWAIKVNSIHITQQELSARTDEVNQQMEQFRKMLGPQADAFFKMQGLSDNPEKIALDGLVSQALMHDAAHRIYVAVSPELVRQQVLASLPKELHNADGSVDEHKLSQYLQKPFAQLEKQKADQILEATLVNMTSGAVYVPRFVVKNRFVQDFADRKCVVAHIPLSTFIAKQEASGVDDGRIKSFFDAQNRLSKRYYVPEKRAGVIWVFDAANYGSTPSEKQVKDYYNRHKYQEFVAQPARMQVRHILLSFTEKNKPEVRVKANSVLQELKTNSALFAQRAKELSADTTTKNNGGLVEIASSTGSGAVFEQAAFKLSKDGDISPVLETPNGFEIIMRVGKKAATYKPIESVQRQIEKTLRTQQFERMFGFEAKYALARAEDKVQALAEFARKKNASKKELALTSTSDDPFVQKLFNGRRDTGTFVVEKDKGYAVIVTDLQKTYQPVFETVKNRVRQDFVHEQATNALVSVLNGVHDKKTFDSIVAQYGAKVSAPVWLRKSDTKSYEAFTKEIGEQAAHRLGRISRAGTVVAGMHGKDGVVVFVQELSSFDQKSYDQHAASVLSTLMHEQKGLVEQAFIASLYKNATIKVSEKMAK